MAKTAIGWTDNTWNPVRGCSRISPGCRHCYAEAQAARIVRMGKGKPTAYDGLVKLVNGEPRWTGVVRLVPEHLADPLRWRAPRRVFVNSMSDLFHESLSNEAIAAGFGVMAACPQHTFQILTKRATRMREWFEWIVDQLPSAHPLGAARGVRWFAWEELGRRGYEEAERAVSPSWSGAMPDWRWPLPNVWPGVSVEDREYGVPRIDELRRVPAEVRMLSCEPLLEDLGSLDLTSIGWVIGGCESGEDARPAKEPWFQSIAAQCSESGVPYFHKQQVINGKLRTEVEYFHPLLQRQEFPR